MKPNKYLINRARRQKNFKKIKRKEARFNSFMFLGEQLLGPNEFIEHCERGARRMDKGCCPGWNSAPKKFRKFQNRRQKRRNKDLIRHEQYDRLPPQKRTVNWDWF